MSHHGLLIHIYHISLYDTDMGRARILSYVFAVNSAIFVVYGIFLTTNEEITLGGVVVLLGGFLGLLITGLQVIHGAYEMNGIRTDESIFWVMIFASFCIVVGTTYQIL